MPHIEGATNDDVTFGAGWVLAKDRGLLLDAGSLTTPAWPRSTPPASTRSA